MSRRFSLPIGSRPVFFLFFALLLCTFSLAQAPSDILTKTYRLGADSIKCITTCFGQPSKIIFVNLHENESTSVLAAATVLDSVKQYCMVELRYNKKRLINFKYKDKNYSIDPNRIYTKKGIKATLKKFNSKYTNEVLQSVILMAEHYTSSYINSKQLVIALHNNTNAGYSILNYSAGGEYAKDAVDVFISKEQDDDDFFYTTERNFFEMFKAANYNAVLQNNKRATDDGSLSIYCAAKGIPYINIEAELGNTSKQKEMIRIVLKMLTNK